MSITKLRTRVEHWPRLTPFHITGYTFTQVDVLLVELERDGVVGRGEATGAYYKSETPDVMRSQIEALRSSIEAGITRESLQAILTA